MNTIRPPIAALFAGIAFSVFLTGCSSLNWPITPVEDVVQLRKQRKSAALEEFDRRRDWAEFQAATNAWNQGDTIRCRESLERLLARTPRHVEARALLAKLHEQAGRNEEALTQVKEALVVEPENEQLIAHRETLLANPRTNGDKLVPGAENSGGDALAQAAWLVADGEAALAQGDSARAIELFNTAVAATAHDPQIPTAAAVSALRLNRPDIAVGLAREAIGRFPDSASLHLILGASYYRSGDYESSQVVLQQALSLDNTNALTYFLQGCTLTKLGKSEAAETHLRRAEQINPRYAMDCPSEKTVRR